VSASGTTREYRGALCRLRGPAWRRSRRLSAAGGRWQRCRQWGRAGAPRRLGEAGDGGLASHPPSSTSTWCSSRCSSCRCRWQTLQSTFQGAPGELPAATAAPAPAAAPPAAEAAAATAAATAAAGHRGQGGGVRGQPAEAGAGSQGAMASVTWSPCTRKTTGCSR